MSTRRSSAEIAASLESRFVEKFVPSPTAHIWRIQAVVNYTGRSKQSIRRDIASGNFPKPIHLGPASHGWLRKEVEQWLADRIAERGA